MSSWRRESGMKKNADDKTSHDKRVTTNGVGYLPDFERYVKQQHVSSFIQRGRISATGSPAYVSCLSAYVRERLNTSFFFFPQKLRDRTLVYAYLEFRGCFHSGSTMHEKQRGGGHPLCPQSHDSTEGMGGRAGVQGNQWMKERKKNRCKTLPWWIHMLHQG